VDDPQKEIQEAAARAMMEASDLTTGPLSKRHTERTVTGVGASGPSTRVILRVIFIALAVAATLWILVNSRQ